MVIMRGASSILCNCATYSAVDSSLLWRALTKVHVRTLNATLYVKQNSCPSVMKHRARDPITTNSYASRLTVRCFYAAQGASRSISRADLRMRSREHNKRLGKLALIHAHIRSVDRHMCTYACMYTRKRVRNLTEGRPFFGIVHLHLSNTRK